MVSYAFHVRRKSGEYETELNAHVGRMPRQGDIVGVVVSGGETIKARVGAVTFPQSREAGEPIIEVHADEVG